MAPRWTQAAEDFHQAHLPEFTTIPNQEAQVERRDQVAGGDEIQRDCITWLAASLDTLVASCRYRGTSEAAIFYLAWRLGYRGPTRPLSRGRSSAAAPAVTAAVTAYLGWALVGFSFFFRRAAGSGPAPATSCTEQCRNR